jgi:hypothetical protein
LAESVMNESIECVIWFETIAEIYRRKNPNAGVGIVSTAFLADATPAGLGGGVNIDTQSIDGGLVAGVKGGGGVGRVSNE